MRYIVGPVGDVEPNSLIDISAAVLLSDTTVVYAAGLHEEGFDEMIAVELAGPVNGTSGTETSDVLYLVDFDGAATVVAQFLGLFARLGPEHLIDFAERVKAQGLRIERES